MSTLYRTALGVLCLTSLLGLNAQADDPAPKTSLAPDANTAPTPAPTRPPLLERSQEEAAALERQVPKAEQHTLEAGEERFLALWKPANTGDPKGAVILVPGAGETPDWPRSVGPLRQKFPDAGWHSLSLSLPDLLADAPQARVEPSPAPPKAAGQDEQAPAKDTPADANANVAQATAPDADVAESTDAVEASDQNDAADAARIFARLDAAVAFAQQQNARTVVLLGHGSGAYWAARYVSEKQPAQVARLVLVSPQTPARVEHGLDSLVPTLKVPTADLYYATDEQARRAAAQRLQISQREKDSTYRQMLLIALPGNLAVEQEQLFRRIRGWLSPHGAS